MPRTDAKETGVSFITFLGSWAVKLLKEYLAGRKMEGKTPIYSTSARSVHAYFRKTAKNTQVRLRAETHTLPIRYGRLPHFSK